MSLGLRIVIIPGVLVVLMVLLLLPAPAREENMNWSRDEIALLRSMVLDRLPPLPRDPSNAYDADPLAARLGERIFHDPRFSRNGEVACVSCHLQDRVFQDGLPRAKGLKIGPLRTMPLIAVAYNEWFFWDGRKDSLWSQALDPIENPLEHGISRTRAVYLIVTHYRDAYTEIFGPLPEIPAGYPEIARPGRDDPYAAQAWETIDTAHRKRINRVFANTGKALAAYMRTILPRPAPFDHFVAALDREDFQQANIILSLLQQQGLKLFIGRGGCTNCHNGPLLTNRAFHNTGVNGMAQSEYHVGRAGGIRKVQNDIFNCLGPFSDAAAEECLPLRFMDDQTEKYTQAFKTPTLRNVADRPPYFHAGQVDRLKDVIDFYIEESAANPELDHVDLGPEDVNALVAFLQSLSGPVEVRRDLIDRLKQELPVPRK